MNIAVSKLTKQGQISVPAEIRKRLDLAPGSALEWFESADGIVSVRRAKRFSSEEIHLTVFDTPPEPKTVEEMDEAIRELHGGS